MSDHAPGVLGRLWLVLYWLGCIVIGGCVLWAAVLLIQHDPDPERQVARFEAKSQECAEAWEAYAEVAGKVEDELANSKARSGRFRAYRELKCPNPGYREPYPWALVGLLVGAAVVAWITGRGLRFILKGD